MKGIAVHPLPFDFPLHEAPSSTRGLGFILLCSFIVVIALIVGAGGIVLVMHRYGKPPIPTPEDSQFEVFRDKSVGNDVKHPGCTRIIHNVGKSSTD